MRNGISLTDEDRRPWLENMRREIECWLRNNENTALACSALKEEYRAQMRVNDNVKFVYLRGDRFLIAAQLKKRTGHFFDPKLLDSQFAVLEEPASSENTITIDLGRSPEALVAEIMCRLRLTRPTD